MGWVRVRVGLKLFLSAQMALIELFQKQIEETLEISGHVV